MKNKIAAAVTNGILLIVVLVVSLVSVYGGNVTAVSYESKNLYYGGSESSESVCLMFNVYENAQNVEKILDILDEHEAKATFFIGGSWADDNIDCVREIFRRGHEIGSHGYFHKDHTNMNDAQNKDEILPSVKILEMICNTEITLFAPPSGAFGQSTLDVCESLGLKVIMWSRDTIDWRDKDVNLLVERATKNLKAGEFILMHPKEQTVSALPEILKYISENGLKTSTISQNLGE